MITYNFYTPPPNRVIRAAGFYISYNDRDVEIYGGITTAIVRGEQMEAFYILTGDHRVAYRDLIPQGYEACLSYYKANIALSHRMSDAL